MKWLLISKQKTLRKKILKEFKRKPDQFDQIFDYNEFSMEITKEYNRIILGDDVWKEYRKSHRWDSPAGKIYWDINKNSRNWRNQNTVSYTHLRAHET